MNTLFTPDSDTGRFYALADKIESQDHLCTPTETETLIDLARRVISKQDDYIRNLESAVDRRDAGD